MQSATTRLLAFFCVLVAVCDGLSRRPPPSGSRGPKNELINSICSTAADPDVCAITAGKCFFMPTTGVKNAFCKCKDSVAGVKTLYNTWVEDGGRDKCTIGGSHAGLKRNGTQAQFYEYLNSQNEDSANLFECCLGKQQGLFNESGGVLVAAWRENAASIEDAEALTAVNAGIDSCASPGTTTCSPRDVVLCVARNCYKTLST